MNGISDNAIRGLASGVEGRCSSAARGKHHSACGEGGRSSRIDNRAHRECLRVRVSRLVRGGFPYLVAPLTVLAVLVVSMAAAHIVPFGDHPFVARDGVIQYVGFFGWYHEVLAGNASLFYSMDKGMGGGTYGLFAYYLSSPFNLLTVFFSPENAPVLLSVLMPVKLCFASLTCEIYLFKRFNSKRPIFALVACTYVLSAWSFVDGLNIMWLDGLILLPLVALGCYRLAQGASPLLLYGSLACAVLFNWYTAYMIFLYAAFYFLAELFILRVQNLREVALRALRWVLVVLLAVASGMVILLPVALEQLGSGSVESGTNLAGVIASNPAPLSFLDFLQSVVLQNASFAGATNAVKVPLVLLALAALAFLQPRGGRFKVAFGTLLGLLVVSTLFKPLDMVWTGFVRADSYNPRYFFLVVFTLCVCAGRACSVWSNPARNRQGLRISSVFLTVVIAALVALEGVVISGTCLTSTALNGYGANSASGYSRYMMQMQNAVNEAKEYSGSEFWRIENAAGTSVAAMSPQATGEEMDNLTPMMTSAERMALLMPGLAHYSSTGSGPMKQLLGNLGYCTLPGTRSVTSYHAPLFLTDSLFGVKYIVASSKPVGAGQIGDDVDLPFPYGKASLYENSSALPIGYAVSADAESVAWRKDDPFGNQQLFAECLVGGEIDPLFLEARVESVPMTGTGAFNGKATWTITAAADGPLYLWIESSTGAMGVWVDGCFLQTTGNYEFDTNVMYLGEFDKGESVNVTVSSGNKDLPESAVVAYTMKMDVASAVLEAFSERAVSDAVIGDGSIRAKCVIAADQKLLLTVPAEAGWEAEIDGRPTDIQSINGLMSLDLEPGEHEVELVYKVPGLQVGLLVSLCGLVGACVWLFILRRKERNG